MRWFTLLVAAACFSSSMAYAHHPDRRNHRVHQYFDVIPPLGRHLPMSHRRKYNRPSKVGGRIMYYIAPSSQEAMAWHRAQHKGYYEQHSPRMITHYFYPKPWETMKIGPRERTVGDADPYAAGEYGSEQVEPAESMVDESMVDEAMELPEPSTAVEPSAEVETITIEDGLIE